MSTIRIFSFSNRESPESLQRYLSALADLRVRVFRDYPYLYDGSPEAELKYLAPFSRAEESLLVIACPAQSSNENPIIGASTALPLLAADEPFQQAFLQKGFAPEQVFYFGESVLLPAYRGLGIGHRFFDERERFAREQGYSITAFCAVERPANHPAKPPEYRSLESFWEKRGYKKIDGLICDYPWKESGKSQETNHRMQFWIRQAAC